MLEEHLKRIIFIFIILFAAEAWPYGNQPEHVAADTVWLLKVQKKYEEIDSVFARAGWIFHTTGQYIDIPLKYARKGGEIVFSRYDRRKFDRIQGEFPNPIFNRMALLMYLRMLKARNDYIPYHSELESRIYGILVNYRPFFDESPRPMSYLRQVLRTDPDRFRRYNAWLAYTEVGAIVSYDFVKLVKERNAIAKECRVDDYYQFKLYSIGTDVEALFNILQRLDIETADEYRLIIEKLKLLQGTATVEPWDIIHLPDSVSILFDSFFYKNSSLAVLNKTMIGLGYTMDSLKITYDLEPRPGKDQGALCMPIHVPDDIRVLANLTDGYDSFEALFHEVGHALHASFIDQPYYIFRSAPSDCFAEAMAAFNEAIMREPEWLKKYAGLPDSLVRAAVYHLKDLEIIELRFLLAQVYFERMLYALDAENPAYLYWDLMSSFMLYAYRNDYDSWASIPQYTNKPVYLQNYIIGNLIAAQTMAFLKKQYGSVVDNVAVSNFMINNYFKPGASIDWPELVQKATGEPLNSKYYIEDILGR